MPALCLALNAQRLAMHRGVEWRRGKLLGYRNRMCKEVKDKSHHIRTRCPRGSAGPETAGRLVSSG